MKTIVVSDQIWEATFIYDWLIDFVSFKENHKQNEINNVKFSKVSFSDNYPENIRQCLLNQEKYWYFQVINVEN
jgi:hypothetical protein